jgi:hypothetical protein
MTSSNGGFFALVASCSDVVLNILTGWTDIPDIVRLDSALCGNEHYNMYSDLAYGSAALYSVKGSFEPKVWDEFLAWAVKRTMKLSNLVATDEILFGNITATLLDLQPCLSKLSRITLAGRDPYKYFSRRSAETVIERFHRALECVASNCGQLTEITINELPGVYEGDPRVSLVALTKGNLSLLRSLSIHRTCCSTVSLQLLLPLCSNLTSLNVQWCQNYVSADAIIMIGQCCPHLQELGLASTVRSDTTLQSILQHCPDLRILDLLCADVTDRAVDIIATCCPQIESVDLHSTKVTGQGYVELARRCRSLRVLNFRDESWLTAILSRAIFRHSAMLTELALYRCHSTDDSVLTVLGKYCPHLTKIDLFGCSHITSKGVTALAQGCAVLKVINLQFCSRVTDKAITAVAAHCADLRELDVSYCYRLTDATLLALAQHCPQLRWVKLLQCVVTETGLLTLATSCYWLNWVAYSKYCVRDVAAAANVRAAFMARGHKVCLQAVNYDCECDYDPSDYEEVHE